jgi:transposase
MLQITPQMKVLVAVEPVDFRKGIDGLVAFCKSSLGQDPLAGILFVFRNRRSTAIKVLVYDGQGYWLCQKRLSAGRFRWWPTCQDKATGTLAAHQLMVLLSAGNPDRTGSPPQWRSVTPKNLDGLGSDGPNRSCLKNVRAVRQ